MAVTTKQRRRLAPEVRQSIILDHAAKIVSAEGVGALSMERLGREADISKSLVYVYFPSVTDLLRRLLQRELHQLRKMQAAAADGAKTMEQLVRAVTHVYLKYIEERGLLIHRLQSEPSVAQGTGGPTDYSRDTAVDYLAKIVADTFDVSMDVARPAVDISFGLPQAAGDYLDRNNVKCEDVEDITVSMIVGAITAIKDNYSVRHMPLVRQDKD